MNSDDQFEAIVSEHYEPLFRFALSLTREESGARDLTQQTFYIWATKGHQLRDFSKVKTWLFTTLHRAFIETRRKQLRFAHQDITELSDQLPAVAAEHANLADCSEVLPALAKVDEIYQAAVALFYLEDCSYKDIAAILEVPIGTVKSRIARGIEQLRQILSTDDSITSSRRKRETVSTVITSEPAAPTETLLPGDQGLERSPDETPERGYDEWDHSSTHVKELIPSLSLTPA